MAFRVDEKGRCVCLEAGCGAVSNNGTMPENGFVRL